MWAAACCAICCPARGTGISLAVADRPPAFDQPARRQSVTRGDVGVVGTAGSRRRMTSSRTSRRGTIATPLGTDRGGRRRRSRPGISSSTRFINVPTEIASS
jgi:hypothetical protein